MLRRPLQLVPTLATSLLLVAGFGGCASSASVNPPPLPTEADRGVIWEYRDAGPQYRLVIGDEVRIQWRESRMPGEPRVAGRIDPTGSIDLPPTPRVKIAGLTAAEAEAAVKQVWSSLQEAAIEQAWNSFLVAQSHGPRVKEWAPTSVSTVVPNDVTLTVRSSTPPPGCFEVRVKGEVDREGVYFLDPSVPKTVRELVVVAGLTQLSQTRHVTLTRTTRGGGEQRLAIDLDGTTGSHFTDPNATLILQPNDEIFVGQTFYWDERWVPDVYPKRENAHSPNPQDNPSQGLIWPWRCGLLQRPP